MEIYVCYIVNHIRLGLWNYMCSRTYISVDISYNLSDISILPQKIQKRKPLWPYTLVVLVTPNNFAIISAWFLNRNCSSRKACAYHDAQSFSLPEQGSIIRFDLIKAQPFSNPSFSLSSLGRCASTSFLVLRCNYQRFLTTVLWPPWTAQHHFSPKTGNSLGSKK